MNLVIEKTEFKLENRKVEESIYSISNGYIGIRGSFEEGIKESENSIEGTYINAFYDYFNIQYAAKYTGYPDLYQRMMPLINIQNIEIWINNERVFFDFEKTSNYLLQFQMQNGQIIRKYRLNLNKEEYIDFSFSKVLSQVNYELFLQNINISTFFKEEKEVCLKFPLIFKENSTDKGIPNDPRALLENTKSFDEKERLIEPNFQSIVYSTLMSNQKVVYATKIKGLEMFDFSEYEEGIFYSKKIKNESISIYKTSVLYEQNFATVDINTAKNKLNNFIKEDYQYYLLQQEEYFKDFWSRAECNFGENNTNLLLPNNFNMFQLYTNIGKLPWTNVAAKGLTGEGYAGHYFWDSEIYIAIALTLFDPKLAKLMLMFRYNTLDGARKRAKLLAHPKGALFPWRTINGDETSTYYPAGTAQYHINGDISFTIINYFKATKDYDFLFNYGIDILVETARVWEDKIVITEGVGHINSVTGPDEYQIIVNDDYWTNCVAQFNLEWANNSLSLLKLKNLKLYNSKIKELKIEKEEQNNWNKLSKIIFHPYDQKLNLNPQHDNFLKRKPVTKEYIENYKPFLRTLHPLSINTLRVTKQADVVLANLFFYNKVSKETMINNWKFYDKTDTADSSLSKCIYAIMAARLRIKDFGFDYFKDSINLDLFDTHKNTDRGLHMANMGGVRMFVIYGLLGINIEEQFLTIDPIFNEEINSYSINIEYQGAIINFSLKNKILIIKKTLGNEINIYYNQKKYTLENKLEFWL